MVRLDFTSGLPLAAQKVLVPSKPLPCSRTFPACDRPMVVVRAQKGLSSGRAEEYFIRKDTTQACFAPRSFRALSMFSMNRFGSLALLVAFSWLSFGERTDSTMITRWKSGRIFTASPSLMKAMPGRDVAEAKSVTVYLVVGNQPRRPLLTSTLNPMELARVVSDCRRAVSNPPTSVSSTVFPM